MPTLVAAVGVSLLAVTGLASPASAADATLRIDRDGTKASPGARAQAFVRRVNGEWEAVRDWVSQDHKTKCTGNLSIREDYKTKVVLDHFYNKRLKSKTHTIYT